MLKPMIGCVVAMLSAAPLLAATECAQEGFAAVVKAVRFSGYPPAYVFRVTNNGTKPVQVVLIGIAEGTYGMDKLIDRSVESEPMSMGSPKGWTARVVYGRDPRLPESHSPSVMGYRWIADDRKAWIQPGQSLSGFSVQLPGSGREMNDGERKPSYPDLADVPFSVHARGSPCPVMVGMVEVDWTSEPLPSSP